MISSMHGHENELGLNKSFDLPLYRTPCKSSKELRQFLRTVSEYADEGENSGLLREQGAKVAT